MEEFWTLMDKGGGGLENWTVFMDVVSVLSLNCLFMTNQNWKDVFESFSKRSRGYFIVNV